MDDWLTALRERYDIGPDAEFRIGIGWIRIVEQFYSSASTLGSAKMSTFQIKSKFARLDIHVDVPLEFRPAINALIAEAEARAAHTCERCGSPEGTLAPPRHIIECEDCRYLGLALDQRSRRAGEIASAARRYVRDCGHSGRVLDITEWGHRRWRTDGERYAR
ncbi:hypothetical protein [Sinorhizobium fredii]|uniref:hypothetical protein n=1 Tax=Rhizobium fredii TaxID=380 RepID=UPI0033928A88